jgi:hypothetical protein
VNDVLRRAERRPNVPTKMPDMLGKMVELWHQFKLEEFDSGNRGKTA